jgi:hypothetical protein
MMQLNTDLVLGCPLLLAVAAVGLSDLNAQRPLPASVIGPPQPNPKEDFMQSTLLLYRLLL